MILDKVLFLKCLIARTCVSKWLHSLDEISFILVKVNYLNFLVPSILSKTNESKYVYYDSSGRIVFLFLFGRIEDTKKVLLKLTDL